VVAVEQQDVAGLVHCCRPRRSRAPSFRGHGGSQVAWMARIPSARDSGMVTGGFFLQSSPTHLLVGMLGPIP
jgi:uncharacterized protein with beta-barrel porin domain